MKSSFSVVCSIKFLKRENVYLGIHNLEIINLAKNIGEYYFTPGSAFFSSENNNSSAGVAYSNSLEFSFPGKVTEEITKELNDVAAIVILLKDNPAPIVMYRNDYYSNTKIIPSIKGDLDKTIVSFNISTLSPL